MVGGEEVARRLLVREPVGGDPVDVHAALVRDPTVHQRLVDALVAVCQLGVLAHHRDLDPLSGVENPESGSRSRWWASTPSWQTATRASTRRWCTVGSRTSAAWTSTGSPPTGSRTSRRRATSSPPTMR